MYPNAKYEVLLQSESASTKLKTRNATFLQFSFSSVSTNQHLLHLNAEKRRIFALKFGVST